MIDTIVIGRVETGMEEITTMAVTDIAETHVEIHTIILVTEIPEEVIIRLLAGFGI